MAQKTIWVAILWGVIGKPSVTIKNGIRTYNPGEHGWIDLKEFDDFQEADEWLCRHVREIKGMMSDYTISRRTA